MYFGMHQLIKDLSRYKEFVIWGAGDYAKKIYKLLSNEGFSKNIKAFTVSDNCQEFSIGNIPVVCIDSMQNGKSETVILVSVSKKYNEEIKVAAKEKGYQNILDINDYFIGITKERELIRSISFDLFRECMADWAVESSYKKLENYELAERYFRDLSQKRSKSGKDYLVFVTGRIFIRTTKIVLALKKKGFAIKIMQMDTDEYPGERELIQAQIEIAKCRSLAELFVRALEEAPLAYYIDPPYQDTTISAFIVRNKQYFGKIIFGAYDIFRDFSSNPLPEYRYMTEQYSLEYADGVVWRYDAMEYFQQKYGYCYHGRQIQFYDYCIDYPQIGLKSEEDKLKICWLPTVLNIHLKKYEQDVKYAHMATVEEMVNLVKGRADCILDIYVWDSTDEQKAQIAVIEKECNNVKFYYHVPHAELMERLQQYDYGTFPYRHSSPPEFVSENDGCYITSEKAVYPVGNKYFDYISAGIPVIADYPEKLCNYLEQFGVIVRMDIDRFDINYLKKNKERYRNQVACARRQLLMDHQIERLISFIMEVGKQ